MDSWISAVGLVVAVGIAAATYAHERRRDRVNHRRDLRVEYLLSAYRTLEHASSRALTDDSARHIEEAIADVQLLGTPHQVDLAVTFTEQFAAEKGADLDSLLDDLRTDLRAELDLGPVSRPRKVLRIETEPDPRRDDSRRR